MISEWLSGQNPVSVAIYTGALTTVAVSAPGAVDMAQIIASAAPPPQSGIILILEIVKMVGVIFVLFALGAMYLSKAFVRIMDWIQERKDRRKQRGEE